MRAGDGGVVADQREGRVLAVVDRHRDADADVAAVTAAIGRQRLGGIGDVAVRLQGDIAAAGDGDRRCMHNVQRVRVAGIGLGVGERDVDRHRAGDAGLAAAGA